MKRLVIALSIISVLGIISPGLPTIAQPVQISHENPDTAPDTPDEVALLLSYDTIINLATSRQFQNAQDALNELRDIEIPDELRYNIDRYSNICQQLITTIDNLESLLDEASAMLANNRLHEAKQRLDNAEVDMQNASPLLEDIEVVTNTLSNQLGISASPIASPIRQARARLEESMERLRQLVDRLHNLQHSLSESYAQMTGLLPTQLSLSINPASAFVGESITASGKLSSEGEPLGGRTLTLTSGNRSIATTYTEFNGSYVTGITIPYSYNATMTLTAVYEPSGDDTDIYLATKSPPITINTMFYQTLLELSAPKIVHPGLPFTISGRVSATDGDIDRNIRVLLDGTQLTDEMVPGQFSIEATPPEQVSNDNHTLTALVTPQGRYSGASENRSINISKAPIYIDTQTPALFILPKAVRISGKAYHEFGPVTDARVNLNLKNSSSTARTSPDGSFATSLEVPLDLSLAGPQELTITVEPVEPWYATTQAKKRLFTINPLVMALLIVALTAVWKLLDRSSRSRRREEMSTPQAEVTELPAITPPPEPKPRLTGIKGRILSAYRGGLETVEKITGAVMTPNITLREFLKMAASLPPTSTKQFTELTTIAEITLYSEYSPSKDIATRAEKLATTINEELQSGTS